MVRLSKNAPATLCVVITEFLKLRVVVGRMLTCVG